jgi:hypothetical protein
MQTVKANRPSYRSLAFLTLFLPRLSIQERTIVHVD